MRIHYINAKPLNDEYADHWYYGAGYYFLDETSLFNGPYSTSTEAETAQTAFTKWLEGGPDEGATGT